MLRRDGRWRTRILEEQLPKLANRFITDDIIHTNLAMPAGTWMKVFEEAYRACRLDLPVLASASQNCGARSIDADAPCQVFERTHKRFNTMGQNFYHISRGHFLSTRWLHQTSLPFSMQPARMSRCSSQPIATSVPKTCKCTWSHTFGKDDPTV